MSAAASRIQTLCRSTAGPGKTFIGAHAAQNRCAPTQLGKQGRGRQSLEDTMTRLVVLPHRSRTWKEITLLRNPRSAIVSFPL
jgi:hypothetical protein